MKAMNTYLHIFIIQNWQNRLWFLKSFLSDTVNVGSVHAVLLKVRVYLVIFDDLSWVLFTSNTISSKTKQARAFLD